MKKDAREVLIEILGVLNEECKKKRECYEDKEYYTPEDKLGLSKLKGRYEEVCTIREIISKIVLEGIRED